MSALRCCNTSTGTTVVLQQTAGSLQALQKCYSSLQVVYRQSTGSLHSTMQLCSIYKSPQYPQALQGSTGSTALQVLQGSTSSIRLYRLYSSTSSTRLYRLYKLYRLQHQSSYSIYL